MLTVGQPVENCAGNITMNHVPANPESEVRQSSPIPVVTQVLAGRELEEPADTVVVED